jgi:hypothetical protein
MMPALLKKVSPPREKQLTNDHDLRQPKAIAGPLEDLKIVRAVSGAMALMIAIDAGLQTGRVRMALITAQVRFAMEILSLSNHRP